LQRSRPNHGKEYSEGIFLILFDYQPRDALKYVQYWTTFEKIINKQLLAFTMG
jgi:hypothetical protein